MKMINVKMSILCIGAILSYACLLFSSALANSQGTGILSFNHSLSYDPAQMDWIHPISSLESWNISNVWSPYDNQNWNPSNLSDNTIAIYDYTPGWTPVPAKIENVVNGSYVVIETGVDQSNPFKTNGTSETKVIGNVSSDPNVYNYVFSDMLYYATLEAKTAGSFTFEFSYNGYWEGFTENTGDSVGLFGSAQAVVQKMVRRADGQWSAQDMTQVWSERLYKSLFLNDGQSGQITKEDFVGSYSVTVPFSAGDGFYLVSSYANYLSARSEPQTDPVPEPTTLLLFGTGLVGLAAARRRKKVS